MNTAPKLPSADQLRLQMGELTPEEVLIAQAAYRLGAYEAAIAPPGGEGVVVPLEAVSQAAAALDVLGRRDLAAWLMRSITTPQSAPVDGDVSDRAWPSWADFWMKRGRIDVSHNYETFQLAELYTREVIRGLDLVRCAPEDGMRKWAQGLIEQLPGDHDGRNSWLLNHGVGDESDWLRAEHKRHAQAWQDWQQGSPQPEQKAKSLHHHTPGQSGEGW